MSMTKEQQIDNLLDILQLLALEEKELLGKAWGGPGVEAGAVLEHAEAGLAPGGVDRLASDVEGRAGLDVAVLCPVLDLEHDMPAGRHIARHERHVALAVSHLDGAKGVLVVQQCDLALLLGEWIERVSRPQPQPSAVCLLGFHGEGMGEGVEGGMGCDDRHCAFEFRGEPVRAGPVCKQGPGHQHEGLACRQRRPASRGTRGCR